MRIGMNLMLWTFNPSYDEHGELLDRLKGFGYDAFEIGIGELSGPNIRRFAARAVELDLEPQAVDLFPVTVGDMISSDPAMRRAALDRLIVGVHKARDLGAKVFSGPFFQGLNSTTSIGPTDQERAWAVEGLRRLGEEGQRCGGIRIAVEPLNRFEMHIANTIAQAYALCEKAGLENVGILADTHHGNIEELDIVKSYTSHIDRIFNIHISENNRGIPGSGHGIPPALFQALKHAGYQGNLIIEAFNANVKEVLPLLRIWTPFADSEDEIARQGLKYIRENLEG